MRFLPLIAATYFMVSGGPYGIEDILGGAGYARAIVILLALPVLWSLPTALMIGELASAIPAEGGFYVWVRRAMGPFWGYQESWLSLSASIFDMAIYPAIFVSYLGKFNPALTAGWHGYAWSLAVVALCCLWNLRGAPAVGEGSVWLFGSAARALRRLRGARGLAWIFLSPCGAVDFCRLGACALHGSTGCYVELHGLGQRIHRRPGSRESAAQLPLGMVVAAALTAVTYILPLLAMALAGISVASFSTGDWMIAAISIGGPLLGLAVVAGGAICGVGMFNALMISYTRLPLAMAEDGMLPQFIARRNRRGVPWVSVLLCGLAWALALNLQIRKAHLHRSDPLWIESAAGVCRPRRSAYPRTCSRAPFQSRQSGLCLCPGRGSGGAHRLCSLRFARGKTLWIDVRVGLLPDRGPAGSGALLAHRRPSRSTPPGGCFGGRLSAALAVLTWNLV